MQVSLEKPHSPPPQKVKNILIRSFTKERQDANPHNLEASHVLKYSPKYYRSLAIEIRPFNPLLSKIRKIKKLKKLEGRTGASFKEILPQKIWFNLLANSRKEIEESPQIFPNNFNIKLSRSFWSRVNLQKIKFFPNMTRVLLSKWSVYRMMNGPDPFVTIKELFVKHLWNLRRLKGLEIRVREDNYEQTKWVFEKLGRMKRLLGRLETFFIDAETEVLNIRELFQNKDLLSHVTGLRLSVPFDPIFTEILQICKRLTYFSLDFSQGVNEKPEFGKFLTSIQCLEQLKSLSFVWPEDGRNFWDYFKPRSSLRQLALVFTASNLINEGLVGENMELKDAVGHWEDIQELDVLRFHISCEEDDRTIFAKQFVTMILKKVQKVHSLRYCMTGPATSDEPFFIEEVPHLYESLERFEHFLSNWSYKEFPKFDLKMMRPFRKLKELKLEGYRVIYKNIEEIIRLLEENQKGSDETLVLKIQSNSMPDRSWLGETLKRIDITKKLNSHLEILIDLSFATEDVVDLLERLCQDIQVVKTIKGVVISLTLLGNRGDLLAPVGRIRKILDQYSEIHNLKLLLYHGDDVIRYRKLDGEKEQFSISQR